MNKHEQTEPRAGRAPSGDGSGPTDGRAAALECVRLAAAFLTGYRYRRHSDGGAQPGRRTAGLGSREREERRQAARTPKPLRGSQIALDNSPWEQRLQALYTAADPQGEPSDALVRRVSELRAQRVTSARRRGRGWLRWRPTRPGPALRPRPVLLVVRWGVVALLVVALISSWPANRRDGGVVEAALRASAAAPALHVVGRGTTDNQELWYRQGMGVSLYAKNSKHETILVDDLRHQYRYEIRERRVYVTRSSMADPSGVALFWANQSGAGMLKQMLQAWGPERVGVETVTREGRTLRQLVGPQRVTRITIDPETDRILTTDEDLPRPDGTHDWERYDFDYPDPAAVDPRHFVFPMPPGVTVVDQTGRR